jgi:hypothetical protein
MRDNMENLVAGGVLKLLEEQPERASDILLDFADDPNIEQNADAFLRNAVETLRVNRGRFLFDSKINLRVNRVCFLFDSNVDL